MKVNTEVNYAGVMFKNPVLMSAADHTHNYQQMINAIDAGVGGIVAKTLSQFSFMTDQRRISRYMVLDSQMKPVRGKITRDFTLMSRGGFMSMEDHWIETLAKVQKYANPKSAKIVGSLWGEADWMAQRAKEMEDAGLAMVELDVGCPHLDGINAHENVHSRVGEFNSRIQGLEAVARAVKIPVIIKFSAAGGPIAETIKCCKEAGFAGATIVNRFIGFLPDIETQTPVMDTWSGVGGPWVIPITLHKVFEARKHDPNFPIMGTNGANDAGDIVRFLLAGATLIEIATAPLIKGHAVATQMVRGLEEYMMRKGVSNVTDLIGLATDRALPRERLFDIHGIAKIDESKCVPCRICVSRCPWGGAFEENGTIGIKLATKGNGDGCIGCGLCTFVCPTQAITIEYSN